MKNLCLISKNILNLKVSIITVSFNSCNTIKKTFESVKNQNYNDIELIVVDGGSTDSTISVIEEYKFCIDKFISEPDHGIYDAMNKGILMSTGDLIGILNSDDFLINDSVITKVVKYHKNNNVDISLGNIVQFKNNISKRTYSSRKWTPKRLKLGLMPPHPSMFVKKDIYDRYGLYKLNYKIASDYEIMIRFFLRYGISWGYSGVTTTKMLMGGVSSSGVKSYKQITKDIYQGFSENNINFCRFSVQFRLIYKLFEFSTFNK